MSSMPYIQLGQSELKVSRLGLGAIPFGTSLSEDVARRVLDTFEEAGGNFIDTANIYGGGLQGCHEETAGTSERTVGRLIKGRRDRFIIATKGYYTMVDPPRPGSVGLHRDYLTRHIEESLRRMDVDTIDLYQCHAWDYYTPVEETLQVLDEFVRAGKIRAIGVSNWHGWGVARANTFARLSALSPIVSNQVWYNLTDRIAENEIVPACRDQKVSVIAWGALAQGFLTGTYRRGDTGPAPGSSIAMNMEPESSCWERLAVEKNWNLLDTLDRIAPHHGHSIATTAMRWMLQAGQSDVILLGGDREPHYTDLLRALDFELSQDDVDQLSEASRPPQYYPNSFLDLFCRKESPFYGGLRPGESP